MEPVSAKDLQERLKKERSVEVGGLVFRVRRVPLLLLADESDALWEAARQGTDALAEKVRGMVANPSLGRLRRVLLAGVIRPRLADREEDESVCVDFLLSDYQLAVGLFVEVIRISLEA